MNISFYKLFDLYLILSSFLGGFNKINIIKTISQFIKNRLKLLSVINRTTKFPKKKK